MSYPTTCRAWTRVLVAVSFVAAPLLAQADHDDDRKMTVCHVPRGNPSARHTISVGENAVDKHLDHGDYLGRCRGERGKGEAGKKLERAEDRLEREKRQEEPEHNRERAEDQLEREKRRESRDGLDRAQDLLSREKRLTKARAERDLALDAARVEANRERNRRKADEKYREKRREILDRYYDQVQHIYEQSDRY